jgi:hypothetical protein
LTSIYKTNIYIYIVKNLRKENSNGNKTEYIYIKKSLTIVRGPISLVAHSACKPA